MPEVSAGAPAPEATPVAAPQATPQQETTANPAPPQEGQQPEKPDRVFTQAEVDDLIKKRLGRESRRIARETRSAVEAEIYRGMVTQPQTQPQQPRESSPAAPGEPQLADFKSYDDWVVAKAEWRVEQKLAQRQDEQKRAEQARQAQERAATIREKVDSARDEYPDIDDFINDPDMPFTAPITEFLFDSEIAGRLIHHLGSNPKELAQIAQMTPAGQFRALTSLESKLKAPPKTSSAPAPLQPTGANRAGEKSPDEMSVEEWKKWREADIQAKRPKRSR